MTKDEKIRIRNLRLKPDGDSEDGKRAFYVGNDENLKIEVDTDDCNDEMAKAAFKRVMLIVNLCSGMEIEEIREFLTP